MNTRTEQDNDITLYTYNELQAMMRSHESNSTSWQPFTMQEVRNEIKRRTTEIEINLETELNKLTGSTPSIISPEIEPFAVFYPKTKEEYLNILNKLQPTEEMAQVTFAGRDLINTFSPYLVIYGGRYDDPNYMEAVIKFKHSICPIWVSIRGDLLKDKFSVDTLRGEYKYTLSANNGTTVQVYYGENKTMYAANEAEAERLKNFIFS